MNYRECYEQGKSLLAAAQIEEAALDARLLLEYVCETNRNDLLVHGEREVEKAKEEQYRLLIAKRLQHIPLQHLTGVQDFMGLTFTVSDKVLVPRQDTEILVEEVLRNLHDRMRILDMCTGSGCILISLLHYSNDCVGVGADISKEALLVARQNALRILGEETMLDQRIRLLHSDLFSQIEGKFDMIVSNPPYIRTAVIDTLMPEVKEHEPILALDGKEDGLYYYQRIVDESRDYLNKGGMLFFEIGFDQAEDVCRMMKTAGFFEVQVVQDYAGLDRVVYGTFLG